MLKYDEHGQEIIKQYYLSKEETVLYTNMRIKLKWSRKDMAKKINCQPKEIDLIETGKPCSSIYGGKYKNILKKFSHNS